MVRVSNELLAQHLPGQADGSALGTLGGVHVLIEDGHWGFRAILSSSLAQHIFLGGRHLAQHSAGQQLLANSDHPGLDNNGEVASRDLAGCVSVAFRVSHGIS
ncbi:hypothetical protein AO265_34195 [Pseudomonas sp. ABAC61]|nr:hypothetical protein AO265_34195 [Pseudomonas sp. ABAC61]